MGKGDQRSRKGKISRGSYGKSRPHKEGGEKKKTQPPKRQPERPRR